MNAESSRDFDQMRLTQCFSARWAPCLASCAGRPLHAGITTRQHALARHSASLAATQVRRSSNAIVKLSDAFLGSNNFATQQVIFELVNTCEKRCVERATCTRHLQDCKDYCRVESCPDGGEVWKEPNGAPRPCTTSRQCPSTHYCTPVTTWTGTLYQTKQLCCPSKNYVCSQPRDVGIRCASTTITRYYFNADTKTCQPFEYNG